MAATRMQADILRRNLCPLSEEKGKVVRFRGILLTFLTACLFGSGVVLAKLLADAFNPVFVSWLALAGGALLTASYQLLRRKPLFSSSLRSVWLDLLLFG